MTSTDKSTSFFPEDIEDIPFIDDVPVSESKVLTLAAMVPAAKRTSAEGILSPERRNACERPMVHVLSSCKVPPIGKCAPLALEESLSRLSTTDLSTSLASQTADRSLADMAAVGDFAAGKTSPSCDSSCQRGAKEHWSLTDTGANRRRGAHGEGRGVSVPAAETSHLNVLPDKAAIDDSGFDDINLEGEENRVENEALTENLPSTSAGVSSSQAERSVLLFRLPPGGRSWGSPAPVTHARNPSMQSNRVVWRRDYTEHVPNYRPTQSAVCVLPYPCTELPQTYTALSETGPLWERAATRPVCWDRFGPQLVGENDRKLTWAPRKPRVYRTLFGRPRSSSHHPVSLAGGTSARPASGDKRRLVKSETTPAAGGTMFNMDDLEQSAVPQGDVSGKVSDPAGGKQGSRAGPDITGDTAGFGITRMLQWLGQHARVMGQHVLTALASVLACRPGTGAHGERHEQGQGRSETNVAQAESRLTFSYPVGLKSDTPHGDVPHYTAI